VFRGHDKIFTRREVFHRQNRSDFFPFFQPNQVDNRLAFRLFSGFGDFIDFQPIDFALIAENQNIIVRGRDKEVFDEILLFRHNARRALAAPLLRAIQRDRIALDIAAVRDHHDHVFFDNQIFERDFGRFRDDFRAARIAVSGFHFAQFAFDFGSD